MASYSSSERRRKRSGTLSGIVEVVLSQTLASPPQSISIITVDGGWAKTDDHRVAGWR